MRIHRKVFQAVIISSFMAWPVFGTAQEATLPFSADEVVSYPSAVNPIQRGHIITEEMLQMTERDSKQTLPSDTLFFYDQIVGQAAKRTLMAGKPITVNDVQLPTIIKRNSTVPLVYMDGSLLMSATGRALDQGAVGDAIRVMNLSSRKTIQGIILPTGEIDVGPDAASKAISPNISGTTVPNLQQSQGSIR